MTTEQAVQNPQDPALVISPAQRRLTIVAASAGNFVEWYDAGVYGITATILSTKLFPGSIDPTIALLNTYGVFAISYLLRPLGGLIFGHMADKFSRKRALSITIIITSLATGLIGLIPDYSVIAWFAPILLLLFRLVQSMGTGGEYTTAVSFVYEHGPKGHKARSVGALSSMTFVGFLVGALLSTILTATLPGDGYASYGWRILFLFAIPIGLVGLYLRRRTEEGPEFVALQKLRSAAQVQATPIVDAFRLTARRRRAQRALAQLALLLGLSRVLRYRHAGHHADLRQTLDSRISRALRRRSNSQRTNHLTQDRPRQSEHVFGRP
jgi:MHS family proline/betaine transporter-like MFS transporter